MNCYSPNMVLTNGVWLGENPMHYSLPLFLTQLLFVSVTTRAIAALLRPLHQPLIVAEILSGLVLGPTLMGRIFKNSNFFFFPLRSENLMKTAANIGLLFFVFTVGLEMDMSNFRHTGRKVLSVAAAGMILPFLVTISLSYTFREHLLPEPNNNHAFYIYLAIALSITSFPILARMLIDIKLMETEIGHIALSSAMIIELLGWILLAIGIAFTGDTSDTNDPPPPSHLIILAGLLFVLLCIFVVRPAVGRFMRRTPEGEVMSDMDSGTILIGVMAAGLMADMIGIHSAFGAFLYGFVIPPTPHATALIGRVEEFIKDLLLPLVFFGSGFRTDLLMIKRLNHALVIIFIFLLSSAAKIGVIVLIAVYFSFPVLDGIALSFLLNPSGFVILSIAQDKKLIEAETYAIMLLLNIIMTITVMPVVTAAHKRSRKHLGYKRRNLQCSRPDSELRMLTCVHKSRNVPSIMSLLDFSNPTKRTPIFVYALHLVELSGQASAMLIVHNTRSSNSLPLTHAQSEHIIAAFETYEQHTGGVSVQPITAVSPFSTMHEDVCSIAEDHHVALIIIPFHKIHSVDGGMEVIHPSIRMLNANVFKHAPCSVGLLVDRGLSSTVGVNRLQHLRHVVVLFFGGADDREALAYAWRMAEHPAVSMTVLRFIGKGEEVGEQDEQYVSEFRLNFVSNESVVYVEKVVSNSEETVGVIRGLMEGERHDLYVVGRGSGKSRLTTGMDEWSECPELGPIGDLLASSDFGTGSATSVLVVQQYVGEGAFREGVEEDEEVVVESPTKLESVQHYLSGHTASRGGGGVLA
ncbi:cation/H(+) antiporter 15-like [Phalaenopsis equestris]|uniref:cation/H(+) antiporter 15-like n=1 Tax=Phalaenopsis equestris TaxID=78828 RepID=UPI0009E5708B|nr:cation/H(+) antiporter 15-like [Phalaenopsis equestris]